MLKYISSLILKVLGWRVTGKPPRDIEKYIIIVMPHTSNWDFPLGLLVRSKTGIKVNFIGKKSLFKAPWGFIFRGFGGYSVDRSKSTSFVDNAIRLFNANEQFALTVTPEGTRSKADQLKTGFYYIALGAKVPIIMVKFDYEHKIVDFAEPFTPTGDKEADFAIIEAHYEGVKGKHPSKSYGID